MCLNEPQTGKFFKLADLEIKKTNQPTIKKRATVVAKDESPWSKK